MAKVRLQARPADTNVEEGEISNEIIGGSSFINVTAESSLRTKVKPKYEGAVDLLRKVLTEQGLAGWYQVSINY